MSGICTARLPLGAKSAASRGSSIKAEGEKPRENGNERSATVSGGMEGNERSAAASSSGCREIEPEKEKPNRDRQEPTEADNRSGSGCIEPEKGKPIDPLEKAMEELFDGWQNEPKRQENKSPN